MTADPIGQALLSQPPASPAPSPPSAISCPHCGAWLLEPRYTMPMAAALMPMSVGALRMALKRYKTRLLPPIYVRNGPRFVRLLTHTDLVILRECITVTFQRFSHRIAA